MEGNLLRSTASLNHVPIIFVNKTERIVNIYWMDYDGLPRKFITLKPGEKKITNTYRTHPWIFRDALTGERMYVEHYGVYWPKQIIVLDVHNHRVKRKEIDIHFPVRTLRENCLWTIVKHMKYSKTFNAFDLPNILKTELTNVFTEYEKYKTESRS